MLLKVFSRILKVCSGGKQALSAIAAILSPSIELLLEVGIFPSFLVASVNLSIMASYKLVARFGLPSPETES